MQKSISSRISQPAGFGDVCICLFWTSHHVPGAAEFTPPGTQLLQCENSHRAREKEWESLKHLKGPEKQVLHYFIHSLSTANWSISERVDNSRSLNPPKNETLFSTCLVSVELQKMLCTLPLTRLVIVWKRLSSPACHLQRGDQGNTYLWGCWEH